MPYVHVRVALTVVFAATLAVGALYLHGIYATVIAVAVGAVLACWIASQREGVLAEHAKRQARAEEYRQKHPNSKPKALAVNLVILAGGVGMIFGTFADYSKGQVGGPLRRILYDILGPIGMTILCAVLAAFFRAMALEMALGYLWAWKKLTAYRPPQ